MKHSSRYIGTKENENLTSPNPFLKKRRWNKFPFSYKEKWLGVEVKNYFQMKSTYSENKSGRPIK